MSRRCKHCDGRRFTKDVAYEVHTVRVVDTPTTVVEEARLRAVTVYVPCRCIGGIRVVHVGRPELDYPRD